MPVRKRVLTPPAQRRPEPIRVAHPAIRTLFETIRDTPALSIKGVARKSGICPESLRKWRRGASASLANVEAALNAAGKKIVVIDVDSFQ